MKRMLVALIVAGALAVPRAASQPAPPVRVAVLVDNGFLVGASVNSIRQGLQTLVDGLPSSDEILLATIAGQMRIRQAPTTDRKKLRDAIGTIFVDQRSAIGAITALPDTLGAIASVIGQHPPR